MRIISKIFFLTIIISSSFGFADLNQKVEEFLEVSGSSKYLSKEGMKKSTMDILKASAKKQGLSAEQLKEAQKITLKSIDKINMSRLRTKIFNTYLEIYSEQELDALIAFYKTPVGIKVVQKQPFLNEEIVKIVGEEYSISAEEIKNDLNKK